MELSYREFGAKDSDFVQLAKWENDFAIRHLFQYFPDAVAWAERSTAGEVRARRYSPRGRRFALLWDGELVGEMSFDFEMPQQLSKEKDTAWFAIVIGEECARGKGVGTAAMTYLERAAVEAGARRAELGVFEFNAPALALYQKLGYREIRRIEAFTYWRGRKWADIRMLKEL